MTAGHNAEGPNRLSLGGDDSGLGGMIALGTIREVLRIVLNYILPKIRGIDLKTLMASIALVCSAASTVGWCQKVPLTDTEKCVVQISIQKPDGSVVGFGTGFFIREDGLIGTAFHVYASAIQAVSENRGGVLVARRASRESGQFTYAAFQIVGADPTHDLAILKLMAVDTKSWDAVGGINVLKLSQSKTILPGSSVTATGYFGNDVWPLTLSGRLAGATIFQITPAAGKTDAVAAEEFVTTLNAFPGQSGSPVTLEDGAVIGVVLAIVPVTVPFNNQPVPTGLNRVAKAEYLQALMSSIPK